MKEIKTTSVDPKKFKLIFGKYEIDLITEPKLFNGIYYFDAERFGTKLKVSLEKTTVERSDKFKVWIKGLISLFNEMQHYKKFENGF